MLATPDPRSAGPPRSRQSPLLWVCGPARETSAAITGGGQAAQRKEAPRLTVETALGGLTTAPDECAEGLNRRTGEPCASAPVLAAVVEFVAADPGAAAQGGRAPAPSARPSAQPSVQPSAQPAGLLPTAASREATAVREAAARLGCSSESCVLTHPRFVRFARPAEEAVRRDLNLRFKAKGPRTGRALLSNFNIDAALQRWARAYPEFYPCPFAMMDFETNGDLFGAIDLPSVLAGRVPANLGPELGELRRPAKCFGCVLNTDTSRGPGKHWVAVFVDCRGECDGGSPEPWTVEYFNSAGRPPDKPVVRWMERTRASLQAYREGLLARAGELAAAVPVTDLSHQESQTECGLYALYYIRRRLEGTPYAFFRENLVPDEAMTEFRRHVFRES